VSARSRSVIRHGGSDDPSSDDDDVHHSYHPR